MTDYFANLTSRSLEPALQIRPRLPGRFETVSQAPQFRAEGAPVGEELIPGAEPPFAADDRPAPNAALAREAPTAAPWLSSTVEPVPREAPVPPGERRRERHEWVLLNQRLDALWAQLNLQAEGRLAAPGPSNSEPSAPRLLAPRSADSSHPRHEVEPQREQAPADADHEAPRKTQADVPNRQDAKREIGARPVVAAEQERPAPMFPPSASTAQAPQGPSSPYIESHRPPQAASPRVGPSPPTPSVLRDPVPRREAPPSPPPQIVVEPAPRVEQPPATVHVTIGRVEVRAVSAQPAKTAVRRTSPIVTLQQYLRERRGGTS